MSEPMLDALYQYSKLVIRDGEGAMPTAFVCAVEYLDSNGEYWFALLEDGKSPKWRTVGLLSHAIDELASQFESDNEGEDDET